MDVLVRCKGFETSGSLAAYTKRKVHQHLSRFGHRVSTVEARLSDVNGPRGGRDKRCLFTVKLPGLAPLHIEELHENFYAGVDVAIGRLAEAVGRGIQRSRKNHTERGTS
jgi:putative sigma-54 modulation protein